LEKYSVYQYLVIY